MGQSATNSYRNILKYEGQNYRFTPTYLRHRDPIAPQNQSPDIKPPEQQGVYPINSLWTNVVAQRVWLLVGITNNLANWVNISNPGGNGSVEINTDTGLVDPLAGIFNFASPNINIIGDNATGTVTFNASPVLDGLGFDVLNGAFPNVFPSAGIVKLRSANPNLVISGSDADTILLTSTAGGAGGVTGLVAGGVHVPANANNEITFLSPNIDLIGNAANSTITFDASPLLQILKFIVPLGLSPVSPTAGGTTVLNSMGGISITGSPNTITFDTSNVVNNLKLRAETNNVAVNPSLLTHEIELNSADGTVAINGNAGANLIDFSAIGSLQHLAFQINGAPPYIIPTNTDPSILKFTASGSTVLTRTAPDTIDIFSGGGGGGGAGTLTPDIGGTIVPVAGNINIYGKPPLVPGLPRLQARTTNIGAGTMELTAPNCCMFIVDGTYVGYGTHSTIQSAINDAVLLGGKNNILIRPGVYVENLTMSSDINLIAFDTDSTNPTVTIQGRVLINSAGPNSFSGIRFVSNGNYAIQVSGTAANPSINFSDCYIIGVNNIAVNIASNCDVIMEFCTLDVLSAAVSFCVMTAGTLSLFYSYLINSGGSSVANSITNANFNHLYCNFNQKISTHGVASHGSVYTIYRCGGLTGPIMTFNGTGQHRWTNNFIDAQGVTAITIGAGAILSMISSSIDCFAAAAITGAGSIAYTPIAFSNVNATITTVNQTAVGSLGPVIPFGTGKAQLMTGTSNPNGIVTAPIGSILTRTDVGVTVNNRIYLNINGGTGWTALLTAG